MADNAVKNIFLEMLKESGMPTTAAEMRAEWEAAVAAENSLIRNNSEWSPFWRLITAIVTMPCLWIVGLLTEHALPNVFLRFSGGGWLDVYAWGVDLARKPEQAAEGELVFSRAGASGNLSIPAGTIVETPPLNGKVYRALTLAEAIIPDGALGARVPVRAESAGAAWNLGPGYYSILAKPVPGVTAVSNPDDWLIRPGADAESDDALRARCRNQFAAVGQYHHDAAYKALIAEYAGVDIDHIFFQKDAPRGPGTANGFIMLESGPAPQALADEINAYIMASGNHGHGDDLKCFPMPAAPLALTARVYPQLNLSAEEREALRLEAENRIRCAFRQNGDYPGMTRTLPLCRFSFSRLADELHDAMPNLRSVVFNLTDIVAYLELPCLESLDVSVEEGL